MDLSKNQLIQRRGRNPAISQALMNTALLDYKKEQVYGRNYLGVCIAGRLGTLGMRPTTLKV